MKIYLIEVLIDSIKNIKKKEGNVLFPVIGILLTPMHFIIKTRVLYYSNVSHPANSLILMVV